MALERLVRPNLCFFPPRLVGSVCIEYLVRLQRTDVLFRDVWQMFKERQHAEIFLRLLEPGILTDKLTYVVPEIMQAFVAHYAHNRMLHRIEQCILHMDIASMDFHQVSDKYTSPLSLPSLLCLTIPQNPDTHIRLLHCVENIASPWGYCMCTTRAWMTISPL